MIVWSMGRSGSHSFRDWLRDSGHGWPFVLHTVCWENGFEAPFPGEFYHDADRPPEGVGEDRLVIADRLRVGEGVVALVPVRNPVDRAVSAWRYFHRCRRPLDNFGHSIADGWWERQVERCMGGVMPRMEPGRGWVLWTGRHRLVLVRIEDGSRVVGDAVKALTGRSGEARFGWSQATRLGEKPELTERFVKWVRGCRTARWFYSEEEIDGALERHRAG